MRVMTTAKERICPDCQGKIKAKDKVLWVADDKTQTTKNICASCALGYGVSIKK